MILSASMMCANYDHLKEDVLRLDAAGIDMFHIDIMDGNYVPNLAMGMQDIAAVRKHTSLPLDAHLMVMNPKNILQPLIDIGVNVIYIHPEVDHRIIESLMLLKKQGVAPAIAVSPQFSYSYFEDVLPYAEYVLLMTVVPGFAGQAFLKGMDDKIDKFVAGKQKHGYKVMMDGAVSPEVLFKYDDRGVDGFILGTSSLFRKDTTFEEAIPRLKRKETR